ncbi:MAG: hypothetical protein IJJ26_09435 [Victivallales bacterium]|nr:hypothetical protein [Victivallales bacterium]
MKHFVLILLTICAVSSYAAYEELLGRWSFVYYKRAPSVIGEMPPPPLFDALDFKDDHTVKLDIRTKLATPTVPFQINKSILQFTVTIPGQAPIPFTAELHVDDKHGTLSITGKDSVSIFLREEALLSRTSVVGSWKGGTDRFPEILDLGNDGFFRLRNSLVIGFYRLWKNEDGATVMTAIAARPGSVWRTFLWEVIPSHLALVMTPIGPHGPNRKFTSVWIPLPPAKPAAP